MVDIRFWIRRGIYGKDATIPTKKGVSLTKESWNTFTKLWADIDKSIEKLKKSLTDIQTMYKIIARRIVQGKSSFCRGCEMTLRDPMYHQCPLGSTTVTTENTTTTNSSSSSPFKEGPHYIQATEPFMLWEECVRTIVATEIASLDSESVVEEFLGCLDTGMSDTQLVINDVDQEDVDDDEDAIDRNDKTFVMILFNYCSKKLYDIMYYCRQELKDSRQCDFEFGSAY